MANYKGYFRANDATSANTAGTKYCVYFITDTASSEYTEIKLAADAPFEVTYDTNNTPFDPMRTSSAAINVVHNSYMTDVMSPYAQGTRVKLATVSENDVILSTIWEGYLKPSVYDTDYMNEYENVNFVANDYLLTLQYLDYADSSAYTKSIKTVASILGDICDRAGFTNGFYWPRTKYVNNRILLPTAIKLSEQNFFSTDTDEPWKMNEVLEEICKYFGMTALQWNSGLYLVDYQNYHTIDTISFNHYLSPYTSYSVVSKGGAKNITSGSVRGDASVSFEPIYNKAKVNCNFNEIETFIPDLFGDNNLTNRFDSENFYANIEYLPPSDYASYWWGTTFLGEQKWINEETADTAYRYFHRYYDNKYWNSAYYNTGGTRVYPSTAVKATSSITTDYAGGTIVDMGVVQKKYYDEETHQYIVPNKMDYTRYLCISQKGLGGWGYIHSGFTAIELTNYNSVAPLSNSSFLVISFDIMFEKHVNRPYINPTWTNDSIKPGGIETSMRSTDGELNFSLKIGDKYWTGKTWKTGTTDYLISFQVPSERTDGDIGYINEERGVLNNISWDEYVNEEGYKIPLEGIDTCAPIDFKILFPNLQYVASNVYVSNSTEWNQYCWIKDFKLLCVQKGQDAETEESDVIYENEIDADAVNELDEIDLKITTATDLTKPSYSNVIYYYGGTNTMLSAITEPCISNVSQKPEENIVEKYVNYYSTKTKKIQMSVINNFTPFDCFYKIDTEDQSKGYIQLGAEINYADYSADITFIESK